GRRPAADACLPRRDLRCRRRRNDDRRDRRSHHSERERLPRGPALRAWDGCVHDDHGQCLRRVPGHGGGNRGADSHSPGWWQPRGDRRGRYARRLLRDSDDPHGGQLQHRTRGAARAQKPVWRDQGSGAHRDSAADRKHPHPLRRGIPPLTKLDSKLASHMAQIALGHVRQEYPHKLDHVMEDDADAQTPRGLHPIFFGSFDWHSCVHGWWTLLTLRRMFANIEEAPAIADLADDSFTAEKVATELAYLDRPTSRGFERPYGWAWLLYLHLEAARHDERWGLELEPLARAFAQRFK